MFSLLRGDGEGVGQKTNITKSKWLSWGNYYFWFFFKFMQSVLETDTAVQLKTFLDTSKTFFILIIYRYIQISALTLVVIVSQNSGYCIL